MQGGRVDDRGNQKNVDDSDISVEHFVSPCGKRRANGQPCHVPGAYESTYPDFRMSGTRDALAIDNGMGRRARLTGHWKGQRVERLPVSESISYWDVLPAYIALGSFVRVVEAKGTVFSPSKLSKSTQVFSSCHRVSWSDSGLRRLRLASSTSEHKQTNHQLIWQVGIHVTTLTFRIPR